jgi:hypothetical protein
VCGWVSPANWRLFEKGKQRRDENGTVRHRFQFGCAVPAALPATRCYSDRWVLHVFAVYHLTDLPGFVSDRKLVMFDPQAKFLPHVNPSNPGKVIDFVDKPQIVAKFADQFEPFRAFGWDATKPFNVGVFVRAFMRVLARSLCVCGSGDPVPVSSANG